MNGGRSNGGPDAAGERAAPLAFIRATAIFFVAILAVVATGGGNALAVVNVPPPPPPTVTSISPSSGPAGGGTSVAISGTNFTGATGVTIGGAAATGVSVVSATSITAITPAGTAGAASLVVKKPAGSNTPNTLFTYIAAKNTTDSQHVRALQLAATKTVATVSGQAITSAVDAAIGDAFAANGGPPIIAGPNGLFLNFAAAPEREAEALGAINALAYAGDISKAPPLAPPLAPRAAPDWSAWADIRGTGFDVNDASGTSGHQVNVTLGVTRKLTPRSAARPVHWL